MSTEISDRDDKWLQLRYKHVHADLQWAKGQAWNVLQWTILLIAAIFWASDHYPRISRGLWICFLAPMTLYSVWWQFNLFDFAKKTRELGVKLEAFLDARHPEFASMPSGDRHHLILLLGRIVITVAAAAVTLAQIWG